MTLLLALAACAPSPEPTTPPASSPVAPPVPTSSPPSPAAVRPNFLVIDIDSLRADRLDVRHGDVDVMPNARALMARGATFTQAFAQSGWTVPALTALLTGKWPVSVDVGAESTPVLPASARLFPEVLGLYDYHTAVVWGMGVEVGFSSLSRGYDQVLKRAGALGQTNDDLAIYDGWTPTEPFALFVHDFDAHVPGPWFTAANMHIFGDDGFTCTGDTYRDTYERTSRQVPADRAMAHVLTHYDGVVHGYDALVGRLLERLEGRGLLDRTIVVITSNHGEDFGEHGPGIKHGTLYDTTLRVPLVVAGPGIVGRRIDTPVQGIDLAPTVLALAHVPEDRTMDGVSFADLLAGGIAGPERAARPVFSLTNARNLSVRTPTAKLIRTDEPDAGMPGAPQGPGLPPLSAPQLGPPDRPPGKVPRPPPPLPGPQSGPRHEYYDLTTDPDEKVDLYAAHSAKAVDLLRALDTFAADRARAATDGERLAVDEALRATVQQGGYWGVAAGEAK